MHIPSIFSHDMSKDIHISLSVAQSKGESICDFLLFLLQMVKLK